MKDLDEEQTGYDKRFQTYLKRLEVERDQQWREEIDLIPFINFPAGWSVQVIPPFADAVARFRVRLPSGRVKSVYLDTRCSIGNYWGDNGEMVPYWEVYPYQGDVGRCKRNEVAELLEMIADEKEDDE